MRALVLLAILFSFGCATTAKYQARVDTWEGRDSDTLLKTWGRPDAVEKQSNGNTILLYARLKHQPYAYGESGRVIASSGSKKTSSEPAIYVKCATYFEVTPDNKVTAVMFRGDECAWKN